ncbi:MAG: hypothetical protein ACI85N_002306, partial [Gammaproteobacteria bacterium]
MKQHRLSRKIFTSKTIKMVSRGAYTDVGGRAEHDYRDIGGRVKSGTVTEELEPRESNPHFRRNRILNPFESITSNKAQLITIDKLVAYQKSMTEFC